MSIDVAEPGVYGGVRVGGGLRLWRHRGVDDNSWRIWSCQARRVALGRDEYGDADPLPTWRLDGLVRGGEWMQVRFDDVPMSPLGWTALRVLVDEHVWWTSPRRGPKQRALYMPFMPRADLVCLVRELEGRANRGVKEANHTPIGVWIRRAWQALEQVEKGSHV